MANAQKEFAFQDLDASIKQLVSKSVDMKMVAYCPYSKYRVGAAVLSEDGTIFTGCNVENASYGLSICAERTALVKAVSEGHRKFKAIAISCDSPENFAAPCGACRQFIAEFGTEYDVYMTKPDLSTLKLKVKDLLPHGFGPAWLLD